MATTMLRFVAETYGPDALEEAWEEFSGAEEPFDPETPHIQVFMPWFRSSSRQSAVRAA